MFHVHMSSNNNFALKVRTHACQWKLRTISVSMKLTFDFVSALTGSGAFNPKLINFVKYIEEQLPVLSPPSIDEGSLHATPLVM